MHGGALHTPYDKMTNLHSSSKCSLRLSVRKPHRNEFDLHEFPIRVNSFPYLIDASEELDLLLVLATADLLYESDKVVPFEGVISAVGILLERFLFQHSSSVQRS